MNKLLASFLGLLLITTKTIAQTRPSSADSIQEVVIFGQKKLPLTMLHNAAKQIPYNYISSDVALDVSLELSVFKPEALPYDYTLKTNLLWYNTIGKPLFYEAYVYADDSLRRIRNNADKINLNDYLYNYNDYPYGDFGQILEKTYQRKSSKDVDYAQLPDWVDRTDGKTYSHILLKYKQEPVTRPDGHDKDTANIGSQDLLIGIFGDFLVDKQTGAFRQIRYIYYPDQPGLYDQYLKMITDNSAEGDQNIEKVLTSNRIHILYWQVKFSLSKVYNKWLPMSYDLKNNFIFNPNIEGTSKERTVRFHYETKSILKNLPKNVTKVKFPEVMFKHTEQR